MKGELWKPARSQNCPGCPQKCAGYLWPPLALADRWDSEMSPSLGSCRGCLPFLGAARIFCGNAGSVFKGTIEHENVEKKGIISKIKMRVNV